MTSIQVEAGDLLASQSDRRITGLLLPFGETGRTTLGRVKVSPGAVSIPADPSVVTLNRDHKRNDPVGRAIDLHASDAGITATFEVARTQEGDDLLAELAEGGPDARTKLSAEVTGIVIRRGEIVSGRLFGAAALHAGAFPSAALLAADAGELPEEATDAVEEALKTALEVIEDNTEGDEPTNDTQENPVTGTPATVAATSLAARKSDDKPKSVDDLYASIAKAHATGDQMLLAALDQADAADLASSQQPQWAGEVWKRRTHRQRFIPLFTPGPLNALKVTGWKFAPRTGTPPQPPATPTVATYAGFPAQPNSTEVKTGPVTINAQRLAGANEFDRGFVDFDTPEFWEGFYRESANDLSRQLDSAAESHLFTAANHTEVVAGEVPVGVSTAAAFIVDGFLAIQDIAVPDFAVIGVDLWREFVLTRREDALEYLEAALSLDPAEGRLDSFKFIPSSHATVAGKVLVGASDSHTFYGPKTVRASTVNIANGGVQEGLFGYFAANTGSADAFALVGDETP